MTPMPHRGRQIRAAANLAKTISVCIAAAVLIASATFSRAAHAGDVPTFAVDPSWPKPLPNNWIIGQVGGITTDSKGNIWVFHRPRSLTDDEKGASLTPPRSKCCVSAPPVLEFDTDGNLLRSWGGPGEGYEWVGREHGIEVDDKGFVWLTGNADTDNVVLKFTEDGKFVMQIGKIGPSKGSNDTTVLGKPAETTYDKDANELYVADGYGNHRVIVFDATTGAYKRHWGANGNKPDDAKQAAYDPKAPAVRQSRTLRESDQRRSGLCLRPHQRPDPGVPQGRQLREGVVLREEHARQWLGMGCRDLARSEADLSAERRRREQ
jgi:hypothetical protein